MSVVADVSGPAVETTAPAAPQFLLWRLSVEQYDEMVRHGILSEDDPVELVEGLLVAKMTKSEAHCAARRLAHHVLSRAVPEGWYVDTQDPIRLPTSKPEPDVYVVRGRPRDYLDRVPGPRDLALVVEVADASLRYDRGFKKSVYAKAAIPVYWIINLKERRVEVYTGPTGPADEADYAERRDFGEADQVPLVIDGREAARLSVRDLLP